MSNNIDIDKFFVSPYDKFLRTFDATHELTPSQVKEIEINKRIAHLRDNPIEQQAQDKIWSDF